MPLHPTVLWAQRANLLFLTVEISDIKEHKVDLTENKIVFKGKGEKEQNEYEAEIEFYAPVNVEDAKQHLTARNLTMVIYKKEEKYWPKIQKGNKLNFVKVDFQKWIDEDEEEEQGDADPMGGLDFQSLMAQAGAAGGGLPNMDDMPEGDESDDEEEEEEQKH